MNNLLSGQNNNLNNKMLGFPIRIFNWYRQFGKDRQKDNSLLARCTVFEYA